MTFDIPTTVRFTNSVQMSFNPLGCRYGPHVIYQKVFICTITCVSLLLLYGSRLALPATIPHLVYIPKSWGRHRRFGDVCQQALFINQPEDMVNEIYLEWTEVQKYYVFSAFYIGYILLPIPSGILCDLYGAKYFLAFSLLGCGLVCLATPFLLNGTSWVIAAGLQAVMGIMQGIAMPAIISLMAQWVPNAHKTWLISYGYSGGCLGTMLSGLLSSIYIRDNGHWEGMFFVWSFVIFAWFVVIMVFVFSRPAVHPYVDPEERNTLAIEMGTVMPKRIPWKGIFHDSAVWALVSGQFGHSYLIFTLYTHLPEFFMRVLGLNLKKNMYIFLFPYLCQWFSTIIGSYLAEMLIKKGLVPIIYMRCICVASGNILPAFIALISTYMGCNHVLILFCFTLAMAFKGLIFAGFKCNVLDITRHYGGVVQGIHNGFPAIVGIIIPQIVGRICVKHTMEEWRKVLWFAFWFSIFTSVYYFIFCKGDRAKWDLLDEDDYERPKSPKIRRSPI